MTKKVYCSISLAMVIIFVVVGFIFLLLPDEVIGFFNQISLYIGMASLELTTVNFYLILAVAYMYLVSVLAFLMYRNPTEKIYPLLLAHGKLASSSLSLLFFFSRGQYLIYLANFIIDALLGLLALYLYRFVRDKQI